VLGISCRTIIWRSGSSSVSFSGSATRLGVEQKLGGSRSSELEAMRLRAEGSRQVCSSGKAEARPGARGADGGSEGIPEKGHRNIGHEPHQARASRAPAGDDSSGLEQTAAVGERDPKRSSASGPRL